MKATAEKNPSQDKKRTTDTATKAAPKPVRLTLQFSAKTKENLDQLKLRSDAKSEVEVVRRALSLFTLYIEALDRGYDLVFKERTSGKEELIKALF
jgi:hypothetical protein